MIRTPTAAALALVLALALGLTATAQAQTPPPSPTPAAPAARPPAKRSIVHYAYPYPYPGNSRVDMSRGSYRNPGGVGRYNEYYGPGSPLLIEPGRDPVRTATFDNGVGVPDRAEQLAAQQIGIARASALQQHIDSYAHPYWGYGFGFGAFGGFN